ncbi:GDSL esterase/lipase 7 [Striga asiatica]|uniref:GDSL esterase/lipase 7 n=1 Tax=Striga asiatica TaxID=4170 RepID=A0A5A7QIW5_STRAF|nr:GDSL esterase/lipase 7 [Striga asiatica]
MLQIPLAKSEISNYSQVVPALYVLGDSLFDSGNNNLLPTLAKADFSPYGMNFNGGWPTGRFTNGRTVVDFIGLINLPLFLVHNVLDYLFLFFGRSFVRLPNAEFLGLPYSPPYLSIRRVFNPGQLTLTGLNFASGSCGILPETGSDLGKCLNFGEQVGLFERIVKEELPKHFTNSTELSNYLAKSIFVVSIGSNDYINNYLVTRDYDTSKRYTPQAYARLLVDKLSLHFRKLYRLGARKVIMFEIGPIGCIPSTTRQMKHNGTCVEEVNQLAIMFNDNLAPMLQNLTSTLQGSTFVLGHGHWLGYDAAINPSNYGLNDSSTACCVTWLNGTSGCIPELGALACRDPEKHYFWDGYHLTETMYRTIATYCFNGSSVCIPKNIQQLISEA